MSSPYGDLGFNTLISQGTRDLGYFVLDPAACKAGTARRVTRTNIAQAGGEIQHKKYRTGYAIELVATVWETIGEDGTPATLSLLREMGDLLMLHLNSIDNVDGRIRWAPSGANERMLDRVRMLGPSIDGAGSSVSVVTSKDTDTPITQVAFALLSPFPYAMDYNETDTPIADGATGILDNTGNSDFYPVIKVHGPTSSFSLINNDVLDDGGNALQIVYNSSLPGAISIPSGHFAEIDCFKNTVYLDGNLTNLKPGIDILQTDFWPLAPGLNNITVGANVDVLWQPAWA